MDFIKNVLRDKQEMQNILRSQYLTEPKKSDDKHTYKIGRKGIEVIGKHPNPFAREYEFMYILLKPHYFKNGDAHNGNEFTISDRIETMSEIYDILNIQRPELIRTTSIEDGLNAIPDFCDTKDIVSQSQYFGKKKFLTPYDHLPYFKNTKGQNEHPTIYCKSYHKGLQFPNQIPANTWRFEVGLTTNRKIETTLGVTNLGDFLKKETHEKND